MSKNQRDIKLCPTDVWASEFASSTQTENGRSLLHFPIPTSPVVGVAGFEPATLRLSSACSNQLSYTPAHC